MGKNVFTFLLNELFRCNMSDSKSEGSEYHTITEGTNLLCEYRSQ